MKHHIEKLMQIALRQLQESGELPAIPALVNLNELSCHQHFTEPPPRYSEATLIKSLEEHGIGRPSTYADKRFKWDKPFASSN